MRIHRRLLGVALSALVAVSYVAAPASAGEVPYLGAIDALCDEDGTYTVVVSITNLLDVETQVVNGQFAFVTGSSTIASGTTVFVPNPVAAGATTVAMVTGPGDSVYVEVGFSITALQLDDTVSLELAGDCASTVTTPSSQVEPTTATTGPPAAVVQPRFTG